MDRSGRCKFSGSNACCYQSGEWSRFCLGLLSFGVAGIVALLGRVGLFSLSHDTEIMIIAPLLTGLLVMWFDTIRHGWMRNHLMDDNPAES